MTVARVTLALCSLLLSAPCIVQAQAAATPAPPAPGRCGMSADAVSYDGLEVGSVVTLQRHRFVSGNDNWEPSMTRYIGREARVTRLAGVDGEGCAGVRVDTDGGSWFWRVRDLGVGTGTVRPPASIGPSMAFPQECGMAVARYGSATVGATVIPGRHRAVNGDTYWAEEMSRYVGRPTRVTALAGLDSQGCPCVRVDSDGGMFYWRIRDFRAPGGEAAEAVDLTSYVPSVGVSTDHGRAATGIGAAIASGDDLFGSGGAPGPQACGLTDATIDWGGIRPGTSVTLGRHRPDPATGIDNWDPGMDPYVGRTARVTTLAGVDDQGCPVVYVDATGGTYYWRIRDMTVMPTVAARPGSWRGMRGLIPTECGRASGTEDYGPVAIGTRVVLGRHTPYSGPDAYGGMVTDDTDWAYDMESYVGMTATVVQLAGTDSAGCAGVRVDIDGSSWFWRIRDMQLAP